VLTAVTVALASVRPFLQGQFRNHNLRFEYSGLVGRVVVGCWRSKWRRRQLPVVAAPAATQNIWRDLVENRSVILDTGPLVALLDRGEKHHSWAVRQLQMLPLPWITCEAVLTEWRGTCYARGLIFRTACSNGWRTECCRYPFRFPANSAPSAH